MPREVKKETLDMIDEVLSAEDPEFMESLEELSPEKLNTGPISMSSVSEEVSGWRHAPRKIMKNLSRKQQLLVIYTGFTCFIAVPILFLAMSGIFTPEFGISEMSSMEDYADEIISIDSTARDRDLMKIFHFEEFIFDLDEHVINLKPKRGIRFGRFIFSIEVKHKTNLESLKKREIEILDVLSFELGRVDYEAFSGRSGKQNMRHTLVKALRKKINPDIFNLYYKRIVFNN